MEEIARDVFVETASRAVTFILLTIFSLSLLCGLFFYVRWRIKRAIRNAVAAVATAPATAVYCIGKKAKAGTIAISRQAVLAGCRALRAVEVGGKAGAEIVTQKLGAAILAGASRAYSRSLMAAVAVKPTAQNAGSRLYCGAAIASNATVPSAKKAAAIALNAAAGAATSVARALQQRVKGNPPANSIRAR